MTMVRCLLPFMVRTFEFRKTLLQSEALQLAFVQVNCQARVAPNTPVIVFVQSV